MEGSQEEFLAPGELVAPFSERRNKHKKRSRWRACKEESVWGHADLGEPLVCLREGASGNGYKHLETVAQGSPCHAMEQKMAHKGKLQHKEEKQPIQGQSLDGENLRHLPFS